MVLARSGLWQEVVNVPASHTFLMPEGMSFEEAAALLVNYITAYMILFDFGNLRPNQSVLIHMAAGKQFVAAHAGLSSRPQHAASEWVAWARKRSERGWTDKTVDAGFTLTQALAHAEPISQQPGSVSPSVCHRRQPAPGKAFIPYPPGTVPSGQAGITYLSRGSSDRWVCLLLSLSCCWFSGGVGTAAIQLCKTVENVTIFGTASASKHESLKESGVAHPIDYRTMDYAEEVRKISPKGTVWWRTSTTVLHFFQVERNL